MVKSELLQSYLVIFFHLNSDLLILTILLWVIRILQFYLLKVRTKAPHEKLLERFAMRKNTLVTECQNRSSSLEGVSMTENSIYYNDKYKIIACFPLKSGTTHWQTLMAILESDGKKTDFDDQHFEYGKSQSLRNLAKSIGRNKN